MRTCVNCDNKTDSDDYNDQYSCCILCLRESRFIMEIDYSVDPNGPYMGYNVITASSLEELIIRFKKAKNTGWDSYLGSCPGMVIIKVMDVIEEKEIILPLIEKLIEEYNETI